MSSFCPDCGTPLKPEWKVCTNCGKQLAQAAPTARQCIQCGTVKQGDAAFCPNCGGQMVAFTPKPTGVKSAKAKKRMIFGGVVTGIAFFAFICMFLPFASAWGMSVSASDLMTAGSGEFGETCVLLAFILSIVTLLSAVGAIFKRGLFTLTMILTLVDLLFWILGGALVVVPVGVGFYLHLVAAIATFVVCIVGKSASKVKK